MKMAFKFLPKQQIQFVYCCLFLSIFLGTVPLLVGALVHIVFFNKNTCSTFIRTHVSYQRKILLLGGCLVLWSFLKLSPVQQFFTFADHTTFLHWSLIEWVRNGITVIACIWVFYYQVVRSSISTPLIIINRIVMTMFVVIMYGSFGVNLSFPTISLLQHALFNPHVFTSGNIGWGVFLLGLLVWSFGACTYDQKDVPLIGGMFFGISLAGLGFLLLRVCFILYFSAHPTFMDASTFHWLGHLRFAQLNWLGHLRLAQLVTSSIVFYLTTKGLINFNFGYSTMRIFHVKNVGELR